MVLCGDVEENPGPPLYFPIRGKIHQGDDIFSLDSRGRQCASCCLSFFLNVMIKPLNSKTWCSDDLDTKRKTYFGNISPSLAAEYPLLRLEFALSMCLSIDTFAIFVKAML